MAGGAAIHIRHCLKFPVCKMVKFRDSCEFLQVRSLGCRLETQSFDGVTCLTQGSKSVTEGQMESQSSGQMIVKHLTSFLCSPFLTLHFPVLTKSEVETNPARQRILQVKLKDQNFKCRKWNSRPEWRTSKVFFRQLRWMVLNLPSEKGNCHLGREIVGILT